MFCLYFQIYKDKCLHKAGINVWRNECDTHIPCTYKWTLGAYIHIFTYVHLHQCTHAHMHTCKHKHAHTCMNMLLALFARAHENYKQHALNIHALFTCTYARLVLIDRCTGLLLLMHACVCMHIIKQISTFVLIRAFILACLCVYVRARACAQACKCKGICMRGN